MKRSDHHVSDDPQIVGTSDHDLMLCRVFGITHGDIAQNATSSVTLSGRLETQISQIQDQTKRATLTTVWRSWKRVFPGEAACFALEAYKLNSSMRYYIKLCKADGISRATCNNRKCIIRFLARIRSNIEIGVIEPLDRPWRLKRLFDLKPPGKTTWGKSNRKLALMPYFVKDLPIKFEAVVSPFFLWRDEQSDGILKVELLDGTSKTLVCSGSWTRGQRSEGEIDTPSEAIFRETFRAFCGFASLPVDSPDPRLRGLGIPVDQVSLAHFMDGNNFSAFLCFYVTRRGACTGTIKMTRIRYNMLMRGKNAYCRFAQKVLFDELKAVVGNETPTDPEMWQKWCDLQEELVEQTYIVLHRQRSSSSSKAQGRSPRRALATLFNYERPLEEVVWPTIFDLTEGRPSQNAPLRQRYFHEVQIFTPAFLSELPLRPATWALMAWRTNLFYKNGRWKIFLEIGSFKNRRVLTDDCLIDVSDIAQPFFTEYHKIWTEAFKYDPLAPENSHKTSRVLATFGRSPSEPLNSTTISQRLKFLKVVWNINVGAHAFRHIVTTDWLKRFPEDFNTASGILNDTENQVKNAYSHLRAADHFRRKNSENANMEIKAREHLLAARRRIIDQDSQE